MSKLKLITPYGRPWAITEDMLVQICEGYDRHQAGEKIDFEGLRAAVEKRTSQQTGGQGYTIQDGVAVISVEGILGKSMNLFMWLCGGTSMELLQNDISAAVDDPSVHSIVLYVDSPGGTVDGTENAANAVAAAAEKKPVVAVVSGQGDSAAYWITAMADKVYLADRTTEVGSIGVVITHTDRSKQDEQRGVKRTHITAGKYKRISADNAPLSEEGRAYMQTPIDYIYSVFLPTMAEARGMDPQVMHDTAADGRTLVGQQAIDAGLADGVRTLNQVIAELNTDYQTKLQNPGAQAPTTHSTGESTMFTQEQLDTARAEGLAQGRTEGATTELNRIKGIAALQMPGHSALIKTMMFDGTTTPEQAAVKIVGAQQEALTKAGTDLEKDAANIAAPASAADPAAEPKQTVQQAKGADAKTAPEITAAQIEARVAKASSEGRKISVIEAKNELVAEAAASK